MKLFLYSLMAAIVGLAAVVAFQFRELAQGREQARVATCQFAVGLDTTLVSQVRAGEALVPTLTYYKHHPTEEAKVIAQDEQLVKVLVPPTYC